MKMHGVQTAGGAVNFPTWRTSPQYLLRVKRQADFHVYLAQYLDPLQHIGMYVVKMDDDSGRVTKIVQPKLLNTDNRFRKRNESTSSLSHFRPLHALAHRVFVVFAGG
jgi:hypothetical protein